MATPIPSTPRAPGLNIYRDEDRAAILARLREIVTVNAGNDPQLTALTIMAEIDALDVRPLWAVEVAAMLPCAPS